MVDQARVLLQGKYSWVLALHFTVHVIFGVLVLPFGLVVVWMPGNFLPGLALLGAAAVAIANGGRGMMDWRTRKKISPVATRDQH